MTMFDRLGYADAYHLSPLSMPSLNIEKDDVDKLLRSD